ncbi:MAG: BTAD domain-containing putative transcriptional regulator [Gemmatimonadota bacterium]
MYSLRLFGRPSLDGPDGPLTGRAAQKHRLALLALLARSPDGSLSRDKLMGCLWPENEATRARHLLNVAVHVLRKELGEAALLSLGDDLRLATDAVHVDVEEFEEALRRGEAEVAVALYPGPFLDGFYLSESPEFEKWVDGERASLARLSAEALEGLAAEAEARGHALTAAERWRTLVAEDPYNTRFVLRLMAALEAAGDRGNAIQAARAHEDLLRDELGAEPDPELAELVRRLQEAPNGMVPAVWAREWGRRSTSSATDSRGEPEPRAAPTTTRGGR